MYTALVRVLHVTADMKELSASIGISSVETPWCRHIIAQIHRDLTFDKSMSLLLSGAP